MSNFYSYGSSSKGNCYLIEFDSFNVVLDIGVDAFIKVKDFNFLKWNCVKFLLISHEHFDHCRYLNKFLNTFNQTRVVINPECYRVLIMNNPDLKKHSLDRFIFLKQDERFCESEAVDFSIAAFSINHFSAANNGYVVCVNSKKIVYLTDCGSLSFGVNNNLMSLLKNINLFLLESNYLETLENSIDLTIKEKRQFSKFGHFSRKQAYSFIKKIQFQNLNCQFCFIHTSLDAYPFPEINDYLYDELRIKHKRIKPIGYDEVLNF